MKCISIKKEHILIIVYIFILSICIICSFSKTIIKNKKVISTFSMPLSKKVIIIDPGHGGWDPGKTIKNDVLEKDINLSISKKLQSYLEQADAYVIMTRVDDNALGDKKNIDMLERKVISNESKADLLVSIHQNSFPKESVKGAQVFYLNNAKYSKIFANCIQNHLNQFLKMENNRVSKPNKDYYILKQTKIPSVIVECGFLTNPIEKDLLLNDEYQHKVAWSIYMGIIDYFENMNKNKDKFIDNIQ